VRGWQQTYRDGLAALDRVAPGGSFAALPGAGRDLVLRSGDPHVAALVDVSFPHTIQLMYGAPEYGGNRDLIGWDYTSYAGDVQPRGWTREQIEQPDPPGLSEAQPRPPVSLPLEELVALAPLASSEMAHGIVARSGGTLGELRAELAGVRARLGKGLRDG
jgi:hypothetical protein